LIALLYSHCRLIAVLIGLEDTLSQCFLRLFSMLCGCLLPSTRRAGIANFGVLR
jgi:hypothetical protein